MRKSNPANSVTKVYSLGTAGIVFEFGSEICAESNMIAVSLSDALFKRPFYGFTESVPAYSSVTIFYDQTLASELCKPGEGCFEAVRSEVMRTLSSISLEEKQIGEQIEIPVDFSNEYAPDLDFVAKWSGLKQNEVINLFTKGIYRVFMLGFLPGFPYMASVDPKLAAPRLETPRKLVPKGSIGIAGRQTGIYPLESPGGWRLIGKTDVEIFRRDNSRPALFAPGNTVRFIKA